MNIPTTAGLAVIAVLLLTACATPRAQDTLPPRAAVRQLSAEEILAVAEKEAMRRGIALEHYRKPEKAEIVRRSGREWCAVTYTWNDQGTAELIPVGGYFIIYVDPRTGETEFLGGM